MPWQILALCAQQQAGAYQAAWVMLSRDGPEVVVGDCDHDAPACCICATGSDGSVGGERLIWPVLVADTLHTTCLSV